MIKYLLIKLQIVDHYLGKKLLANFLISLFFFFFFGLPLIILLNIIRVMDFFFAYTIKMVLILIFLIEKNFLQRVERFIYFVIYFFIYWIFPIRIKKFIFFIFLFIVLKSPSNLDLLNWNLFETVRTLDNSKNNVFFFKNITFFDFRKNYLNKLLFVEKDILYSKTSAFINYNTEITVKRGYPRFKKQKVFTDRMRTKIALYPLKTRYGMDWPLNLNSVDYWILRRTFGKGWLPFEQIVQRLQNNGGFFFFSEMSDYINIFIVENLITDSFFVVIKYYVLDFLLKIRYFDFLFLNLKENICFAIIVLDDFFLLNIIICIKIFLCSLLNLVFEDLMGISLRIVNYLQWDIFTIESFFPLQAVLAPDNLSEEDEIDKRMLKAKLFKPLSKLMFDYFLIKNKYIDSDLLDIHKTNVKRVFKEGILNLNYNHYKRTNTLLGLHGTSSINKNNTFDNFFTYHPFVITYPSFEDFSKLITNKIDILTDTYEISSKPLTWSDFFLSRHTNLFMTQFNKHVFSDFFDYFYESRFEKNVKYNRRLSYFNRLYWSLFNFNEVDDYNRFKKIPSIIGVGDYDDDDEDVPIDSSFFENNSSKILTKYTTSSRNFFSNDTFFQTEDERAISFSTHSQFVRFIYKCLFNFYFIFVKPLFYFFFYPLYFILFYFLGVIVVFFFYFFFLRIKIFYFLLKRFILMIFLWSKKKNEVLNLNLNLNELYDEDFDDESDEDDEDNINGLKFTFKVAFLVQFLEKFRRLKKKKRFNYFFEIFKIEILSLKISNIFLVLSLLVFCLVYFILSSIFFSFFCFFYEIYSFVCNFIKKIKSKFINICYDLYFFSLFLINYTFKNFSFIFEKSINIFKFIISFNFLIIYLPICIYRLIFSFFIFLFKFFWFLFLFFLISFFFFLYFENYLDLTIQKMLFKQNFQDLSKIYNESQILTTNSFKNTYVFGFEETPLSQTLIIYYVLVFIYFLSFFFDKFNDNFLRSSKSFIYQEDSGMFRYNIPAKYEINSIIFELTDGKKAEGLEGLFIEQEPDIDFNIISVWHELLKRVKINSFFLYKIIFLLNSEIYFFNNFRYLIMNLDFSSNFLKKLIFSKKLFHKHRNYNLLTKKKIRLLLVFLLLNKQFFYFKFTKKNLKKIFNLLENKKIEKNIIHNSLFLILLKNLEFFLSKIRFDEVSLNNNLIKKLSFFNKNLSKKELKFKFTSFKIKLVLNPFKYNAFMFNNIRVFEKNVKNFNLKLKKVKSSYSINYENFYPLNSRVNWSLYSWYRKVNGKRTNKVMPNGSFYFWSFYVGFFHSHVFFKTYNDSLRFLLNKWKFPRVVYDSLLDMYFQSSNETRFFASKGRHRVKYGTLNIKTVAIYFPYAIDEFMIRELNRYLFKHLRSLYRYSSEPKNEQTVRNFKASYKDLFIYKTFDFSTETFYHFEFFVKSFLFYLKNRFYFNKKALYKVINQFFHLKKKKKILKQDLKKKNLTFKQQIKLKNIYINIEKYLKFKLKKKSKSFCIIKELFFLLKKKKHFVFFFFNKKGYLEIVKKKKISLCLYRKRGKYFVVYNLRKRKRHKLSFKRFEKLFNYFYYRKDNINFRNKINKTFDFTKFKYLTKYFKFQKINKFKIIIRRKNIGFPFIKNLKMIYIKLQGKSFILLKKCWRKNNQNFDLGYVLFLLKKRNLWFDRFDFNFRRHIRRARLGFGYVPTINDLAIGFYSVNQIADDESSYDIYFPNEVEYLDDVDEIYEDDNVSEDYATFFFSEHPFSELFLNDKYENKFVFLNPLTFFEFKKSLNQTDKDILYDSFWITDLMIDRCLINSVSLDSVTSKDRFVVSNLSIYSNFLNFKNYSIDFEALSCESNLLRNFIFHIWDKIPNTIIRNFFDFRLLRYSYPFLNPYTLGNFDLIWPAQKRFNRLLFKDNLNFPITPADNIFNIHNSTKNPSLNGRSLFERGFFFLIFYNPYNKKFLNYIKEYLGIKVFPVSGDEIYSNQYKRLFFSNVDFYIEILSLKTYPDLNKEDFERILAFFGCTAEEWDSIDNLKLNLRKVYDDWEFPIFLWCMLTLGFDKLGSILWSTINANYREDEKFELESWFLLTEEEHNYTSRTGFDFFDNFTMIEDTVSLDLNYSLYFIFFYHLKTFIKGIFEGVHELILLKNSLGDFKNFNLSYTVENIERFFFFSTLNQYWLDFVNFIGFFRSFFFFLMIENNFLFLELSNKLYFIFVYVILFFIIYLNFIISFFIFCYIKIFFQIFFLINVIFDLSLINFGFLIFFNFHLFLKYLNIILDFIYLFIF